MSATTDPHEAARSHPLWLAFHAWIASTCYREPDLSTVLDRKAWMAFIEGARHADAGLLAALKGLFGMIEAGTLVRDTSHDSDPKWFLTAIELSRLLQQTQAATAKAGGAAK